MDCHMEMIYLDSGNNARKTGMIHALGTDDETVARFEAHKALEVERNHAKFLLDLYDASGDIIDTIYLDASGFQAVTGEKPKNDAAYRRTDDAYWTRAQALQKLTKEERKALGYED